MSEGLHDFTDNDAADFISANEDSDSNLFQFLEFEINVQQFNALSVYEKEIIRHGIFLLGVCHFLHKNCFIVVIGCQNEDLAFDMFQTLNASGTPLTSFEVFKPKAVSSVGNSYQTTLKPFIDRIENILETETTSDAKERLNDKIIVSSAVTYNGEIISAKFSDGRNWLNNTFTALTQAVDKELFLKNIAIQSEFYNEIVAPNQPKINSQTYRISNHLSKLGMGTKQADITTLCIYYLKKANHTKSYILLSVFYGLIFDSAPGTPNRIKALSDFEEVCKATAAFFTLWMGSLSTRFPDKVYTELFTDVNNISIRNGKANQKVKFVKDKFKTALTREKVFDINNNKTSKFQWVLKAKNIEWYKRQIVSKFALFCAHHDATADTRPGYEGLLTSAQSGANDLLTCAKWFNSDHEVIEHVAPQNMPKNIKYKNYFDLQIYPGNTSVVNKIGNLANFSRQQNSSIDSEWPEKVFFYWSLTTPTANKSYQVQQLLTNLGLTANHLSNFPPSLHNLSSTTSYLVTVAPIAYRGAEGLSWDKAFIEKRSEHLCERVYDKLSGWL